MTRDEVQAYVKLDALLSGLGGWIPENPDVVVFEWLHAWLGPHWILVPQPQGAAIVAGLPSPTLYKIASGQVLFEGPLGQLLVSPALQVHSMRLKLMDPESQAAVERLSWELSKMLGELPVLAGPQAVQRSVQAFFDEHVAQSPSR